MYPQKCAQYGIWCRGILRPLLSCPHLPLLLTLELIIATTSLIIIIVFYICFPLSTRALARAVMIKKIKLYVYECPFELDGP